MTSFGKKHSTTPDAGHDDAPKGYASPSCFMHELDPSWLGYFAVRNCLSY